MTPMALLTNELFCGEDDDLLLKAFLLSVGAVFGGEAKERRNRSAFEQRLIWNDYSEKHVARGTFKRRMRMDKDSFDKLLSYICNDLLVDEKQANRRGGPVTPESCLCCTLRWLAGGSHLDIADIAGISKTAFYTVTWRTIAALVMCPQLSIHFPTAEKELLEAVGGFASTSTECATKNCVGVVDGHLMRIKVPNKKEVPNVRSFFSGHYQCYGVNIQAVADHHSRFVFFAVAGPGVIKDREAARGCALKKMLDNLPLGCCIIGDSAYEGSEHLVPICSGLDRLKTKHDNFNCCASQCRIRIEMAFGLVQIKWRILLRPIGVRLNNLKWMAQAIARLHNFVVNERLAKREDPMNEIRVQAESGRATYHPTVPHDRNGDPIILNQLFNGTHEGHSHLREEMVRRVEMLRLSRPAENKIKKDSNNNSRLYDPHLD